MKKSIMKILYTVSAFLDDIAFYIFADEEEETGFTVRTRWCEHFY